jgi:hypothetical protein
VSSNEVPAVDSQPNKKFIWIAIGVVAVIAVGTSAGLVGAALSSSSSTSSSTAPAFGDAPLTNPNPLRPGGFAAPQAVGVVASISSSKFTLTTRQNSTVTVDVTSSTTFSGVGATSIAALKKGTAVAVYGKVGSNSTITATRVTSGFGGLGRGRFGGGGTFGAIASIGSNSFTITSSNGTNETVKVTASTSFEDTAGTLSGLSSLKKGESVLVRGTVSGSVVTATDVRVVVPGAGGFGGGFGDARPGSGMSGGVPLNPSASNGL